MSNITKKIVTIVTGLTIMAMAAPAFGAISAGCRADISTCTTAELGEYITELTTTVNALTARLATLQGTATTYTGIPAGFTFTKDLSSGMKDTDVIYLKAILDVEVADHAAWSGTNLFGPKTEAAVKAFQTKYGITVTGVADAATRVKLNALLAVVTPPVAPEEEVTVPVPPEEEVTVTEGNLTFKLLGVPSNATIVKAGQSDISVMSFELKAYDSDITVKRIDLYSDGYQKRPAKNLSAVSLYDGTNLLQGVTTDDFVRPAGESYFRYRYNLNVTVPKGTIKTLTFKVSALSTVTAEAYKFTIPATGIRYIDTAGVTDYIGGGSKVFTMAGAVTGVLTTSLSTDTPVEGIVIGSKTAATENVELLKFNLKASQDNVGVDTIVFQATSSATVDEIISAVKLYDGTTLIGSESFGTGLSTTTFSGLGLIIAKNTTNVLTVKADLNLIDGTNATTGDSVLIGVPADSIVGEDSSYNTVNGGNVTGNTEYIYLAAPKITLVSASIDKVLDANNKTIAGDGTISFKVMALGGDIVIPENGVTTTAATTTAAANATTTGQEYTIGGVLLSDAERTITKDSEKTITAKARVTASTNARVRLIVSALSWTAVNTFNVPASLLKNLVTPTVLID